MAIKFLINKELINYIYTESQKKHGVFAKDLGVSTKALRAYLDGEYKPRNVKVIAKIQRLANDLGAETLLDKAHVPDDGETTTPAEKTYYVNGTRLKRMREASGLTVEKYAEQFGLLKTTYVNYEYGAQPTDAGVRDAFEAAWQEYIKTPGAIIDDTEPEVDGEFSPEILKKFQARRGLSVQQVADLLGVSADSWYKWIRGVGKPSRANNIRALRKALNADDGARKRRKNSKTRTPTPAAKGGKHQVSVASLHEIAKEFHERYQPQIDEAKFDFALTLVCEKHDIERSKLRRVVAALLLILKDSMTPQELYERLSGHSS